MRVSIWQQFSSNHSGTFWVVGEFESVEKAQSAYDEIRNMLVAIDHWHRNNFDESEEARNTGIPTTLEQAYAKIYDVEWKHAIDWEGWGTYFYEAKGWKIYGDPTLLIDDALALVGRVVRIQSPNHNTWMTQQPFRGVLDFLGAETGGYNVESGTFSSNPTKVIPHITFVAPDLNTADRIEKEINTYMDGDLDGLNNPPPWSDDKSNFEKAFALGSILRRDVVETIMAQWERHYQSDKNKNKKYADKILKQRLRLSSPETKITRDNLVFTIERLYFHTRELGLCALIAYLEVNGCKSVDLTYLDVSDEEWNFKG